MTNLKHTFKLIINASMQDEEELHTGPWRHFLEHMRSFGYSIDSSSKKSDLYVFIGHTPHHDLFNTSKIEERVLILWEPPVTEPKAYTQKVFGSYRKVILPYPLNDFFPGTNFFYWPQNFQFYIQSYSDWKSRREIVMMQANKFSFSKNELYTLRRKVLISLGRKYHIELYGRDWNMSAIKLVRSLLGAVRKSGQVSIPRNLVFNYPTYIGEVKLKPETVSQYRISIIIENDLRYFSEKFFDAVACQTIPIYVGPNLDLLGLKNLDFLQSPPSVDKIRERLDFFLGLDEQTLYNYSVQVQQSVSTLNNALNHRAVFRKMVEEVLRF